MQLQDNSIHYYDQLKTDFLSHIATARKQKRTALTLFNIKQQKAESLRTYVLALTTAPLEVPITSKDILSAFFQGLKPGKFFESLSLDLPDTFNNLLQCAELYINLEDAQKMKREERAIIPSGRKPGKRDEYRPPEVQKGAGHPQHGKIPAQVQQLYPVGAPCIPDPDCNPETPIIEVASFPKPTS